MVVRRGYEQITNDLAYGPIICVSWSSRTDWFEVKNAFSSQSSCTTQGGCEYSLSHISIRSKQLVDA